MPPYMDPDEADESFIEVIDLSTDKPRVLVKKNSLGSAKQISVDPISLRESSNSQLMVMYPITAAAPKLDVMIPLPPPKNKFLSQSLSNSASPSPRFGSHTPKKKCKSPTQLQSSLSVMHRQDSIALANLERLRELHLLRSKSCGEGRASAPPEDFDIWLAKADGVKHENNHKDSNINCFKIEKAKVLDENSKPGEENIDTCDEKFKCKALCLYLPAFGKGKPVKARRQGSDMSQLKEPAAEIMGHVVSKRVSLEKFDCGSWNIINDDNEDEGDASNLFFDLPLEMIRCSVNDTHSPITTAFVFDKEPKGVLKHSTSKSAPSRKSTESVRHVRFSTSSHPASPTSCITPRLRKARDDFNAFLEAQSA